MNNLNRNFKGENLIPVQISKYIEVIDKTIHAKAGRKFQTMQTVETGSNEIFIAHWYTGQVKLNSEEIKNLPDPLALTELEFLGKEIFTTDIVRTVDSNQNLEILTFSFNLRFSEAENWHVMSAVDERLFKNSNFYLPHIDERSLYCLKPLNNQQPLQHTPD